MDVRRILSRKRGKRKEKVREKEGKGREGKERGGDTDPTPCEEEESPEGADNGRGKEGKRRKREVVRERARGGGERVRRRGEG